MFSRFRSVPNRDNNAKILTLLHGRAKQLPRPVDFVFAAFSSAAHSVIEDLWDRADNLPKLIPEKIGELSSDRFSRLYHATMWSFIALYVRELDEEEAEAISRVGGVFVGPLNREPAFADHLLRVINAGGRPEFLCMKLHAHYRAILGLPPSDGDLGISLTILFTSAYERAKGLIHEDQSNRIFDEFSLKNQATNCGAGEGLWRDGGVDSRRTHEAPLHVRVVPFAAIGVGREGAAPCAAGVFRGG